MMSTQTELTPFSWEAAVPEPTQRDLFGEGDQPPATRSGLFAEIVFDRPLDHAYTYAVPESLRQTLATGKRVLAPFGRGDRPISGFCVNVTETGPDRHVKEVIRVLDEEALLDDN